MKDVQQKVKPYILAIDMSGFKYDDFLRVLNTINQYVNVTLMNYGIGEDLTFILRLAMIGLQFCGEGSDSLQESMRLQSLKYFRNFHR